MKRTMMMTAAACMMLGAPVPVFAAMPDLASIVADSGHGEIDRRGRGRGGRDGSRSSDDDNGGSGSGRSKPRVPGGSGCDDPGDIAEHAECRV
ncbi:MAG: hypothetical protein KDE03_13850 [Rhodobacteraceae bacterium]|nr:hypothetical protein [Paracoccaceae bacterium]